MRSGVHTLSDHPLRALSRLHELCRVNPLACSLVGEAQRVLLAPNTLAARLYASMEATEHYFCNYGVNPDYRLRLEANGLRVSGMGEGDEIRIVELAGHPFFVATLFLPQARSTSSRPHPLLVGYAAAAAAWRAEPLRRHLRHVDVH
jgi:CTP synthase (UTP-ammonia lyase)